MVRKKQNKTLETNVVKQEDPYSLANIEQMIKEKSSLVSQMESAAQQLKGQIALLTEMRNQKLRDIGKERNPK